MKKLISLCLLASTTMSWGDVIKSHIHSIERVDTTSPYIVKFENGRVGFLSPSEKSLNSEMKNASMKNGMVEAKLDEDNNVISIRSIEDNGHEIKTFNLLEPTEPPKFEPTILDSYEQARKIFNRLNPNYKRASECSNRAHVWAHEEFTKNGLKSQKMFLFFTATYITKNRTKWWFHVAPMFQVRHQGKTEGYVMDYMFDRAPKTFEDWKNNYVYSKRQCKIPKNFTEYDLHADQTEDCYKMVGTMYDWMPTEFRNHERGIYKTEFSMNEVRAAYSEAF